MEAGRSRAQGRLPWPQPPNKTLQQLFHHDPQRAQAFSTCVGPLRIDLSRQPWDPRIREHLLAWGQASGLAAHQACWQHHQWLDPHGQKHPLAHVRERHQAAQSWPAVWRAWRLRWLQEHEQGLWSDVIHVGVGGSVMGPRLLHEAWVGTSQKGPQVHWVDHLDLADLKRMLAQLNPQTTRVLLVSKSFTTFEVLHIAQYLRAWLQNHGASPNKRLFAITACTARACAMGLPETHVLSIPQDLSGRFSVWSPVSFSVSLCVPESTMSAWWRGACEVDAAAFNEHPKDNGAIWNMLLHLWSINVLGVQSSCLVPYHNAWRSWPAWCQQLELESLGKPSQHPDAPHAAVAVWGYPGMQAQHSFFQWLHQGSERTLLTCVVACNAQPPSIFYNALAHMSLLMCGAPPTLPGNRPSTSLMLPDQSPSSLGALMAWSEHQVMMRCAMLGIHPFDQPAVDFGKQLAQQLEYSMHKDDAAVVWDAATQATLQHALAFPKTQQEV